MINNEQIGKYRTYTVNWTKTESEKLNGLDIKEGEMLTIDGLNETEIEILKRDLELPYKTE